MTRPRSKRATVLAFLLLAACDVQRGPPDTADWDVLNEVGSPTRFEKSTWPVDDASCIDDEGIMVLGDLSPAEYERVIAEVRETHPRDAILLVRRDGSYADVLTGVHCTAPGAGGGDVYFMRLEGRKWKIRKTEKW